MRIDHTKLHSQADTVELVIVERQQATIGCTSAAALSFAVEGLTFATEVIIGIHKVLRLLHKEV